MKNKVNEIKISYDGDGQKGPYPQILNSSDAGEILFGIWDSDTIAVYESFKILLLNNNNSVKGVYEVSKGAITGTLVDVRIVFAIVLKSLSVGLILAHNHPSGTLRASEADRKVTDKIKKAAALFDVKLLDHLILVPNGDFFSFADNGLI